MAMPIVLMETSLPNPLVPILSGAYGPRLVALASIVVAVCAISFVIPQFSSPQNMTNVLRGTSILAIVACGQMLVMIVGGLDLSIGACMALCSVLSSTVMVWIGTHVPDFPGLAIAGGVTAALGCGLVVGLINGGCVAHLSLPPLVVTLGSTSVASGIAFMLTNGIPIYGLPATFVESLGRTLHLGLPNAVWVAIVIVVALVLLQRHTSYGPRLTATGDNLHSAKVSGIATHRYIVSAYVCSSLFASLASLLLTAQIGSGQSSIGERIAVESIAAAVIGGVSIRGGYGRPEHVVAGTLLLILVGNIMDLLQMNSRLQMVILGLLVIMVAGVSAYRARRA